MALRIVVSGATGRMGGTVASQIAEAADLELAGGIDRPDAASDPRGLPYERLEAPTAAGPLLEAADAVVDFSAPPFLAELLERQADALAGRALVVGTTGLEPDVVARLDRAAERSPVLVASNFSIGVNLLLWLVEEAARRLPSERYDVEVIETHHRHKADAPSGTAVSLGDAVARARSAALEDLRRDGRSGRPGARSTGEIGFHAVRGGEVTGEHRVVFLAARERLELAHAAADRALFVEGALLAVRWVVGRPPGRYGMRDVLGTY